MALPQVGLEAVIQGMAQFKADSQSIENAVTSIGSSILKLGAAGVAGAFAAATGAIYEGLDATLKWGESLDLLGDRFGVSGEVGSKWAVAFGKIGMTVEEGSAGLNIFARQLDNVKQAGAEMVPAKTPEQIEKLTQRIEDETVALQRARDKMASAKKPTAEMGNAIADHEKKLARLNEEYAAANQLVPAAEGKASAFQKALETLGVKAYSSEGKLRTFDELMPEIMDKFKAMPSGIEASALAMDLFGRSGSKFLDFLRQGGIGLEEARQMAKDFGLEMSTKDVDAIETYGFAVSEMNMALQGVKIQIGKFVLPYARMFVDWVKGTAAPVLLDFAKKVIAKFSEAAKWVEKNLLPIFEDIQFVFKNFQAGLIGRNYPWENVFPPWLAKIAQTISDAVFFVIDHLDAFKGVLEGIGAVLAGAAIATAIAGIVGAVVALANPITAIIAVGALLGVAWETNWMGMRDTLTAFWEKTARPALEKLYDWFQVQLPIAMQALSDFWNTTLLPAFQSIAAWLGENVPIAMQKLSDFWYTTLLPAVQDISTWFADNIPIALQAVSDFWSITLKPALEELRDWLGVNIPIAAGTLKVFWEETLLPAFGKLSDFWIVTLKPALQDLQTWLSIELPKAGQDFVDWSKTDAIPALEKLKPIFADISKSVQDMAPVFEQLGTTFAGSAKTAGKSGIDLKKIAAGTFSFVADYATKKLTVASDVVGVASDVMTGDWSSAFTRMTRIEMNAIDLMTLTLFSRFLAPLCTKIGKALAPFIDNFFNTWDQILRDAAQIWERIKRTVSQKAQEMVKSVVDWVSKLPSEVSKFTSDMLKSAVALVQSLIDGVASKGAALLAQVSTTVSGAITSLSTSITSGALWTTLKAVGSSIISVIGSGVASVLTFGSTLISKVVLGVADLISSVTSAGGTLYTWLKSAGTSVMSGIVSGVLTVTTLGVGLIGKVLEAVGSLLTDIGKKGTAIYNALANIGSSIIGGIVDALGDQAYKVINKFAQIIQDAVAEAKRRLGISCPDPSPVTYELGIAMVEGLKRGMLSTLPSLIPALEASMGGLVLAPSVAGPALGAGGASIYNTFNVGGNTISSGMDQAVFEARVLGVIRKNLR